MTKQTPTCRHTDRHTDTHTDRHPLTDGDGGMYTPARMQLQMTSVLDENVHCIAVQGTFDDCQVRARTHARSLARVLRMHAQV